MTKAEKEQSIISIQTDLLLISISDKEINPERKPKLPVYEQTGNDNKARPNLYLVVFQRTS